MLLLIQLGWGLVFLSFLLAYQGASRPWLPYAFLAAGAAVFVAALVVELLQDGPDADPGTAAAVGAVAILLGVVGIEVGTDAGRRRRR